jgi:hypothetical protein
VLVFAEPGNPYPGESYTAIASTFRLVSYTQPIGPDKFHRNVKAILDLCWPQWTYEEQLRKVWMTESVLCSAPTEGGPIRRAVSLECARRYLLPQLNLLPHALVVALGRKAQDRLRAVGYTKFLAAVAAAPPGCDSRGAKESWARIPIELERARAARSVASD